jgi:hypothetical protein
MELDLNLRVRVHELEGYLADKVSGHALFYMNTSGMLFQKMLLILVQSSVLLSCPWHGHFQHCSLSAPVFTV